MPYSHQKSIGSVDPDIANLVSQETQRIRDGLQLIPSENFMSRAVLEATASVLANKYAEGYPGKRYYEGNEIVDRIELLAIKRAKSLFGAEHANVQSLSGGPANMAAYEAILEEGDTVMSMNLAQGGHLTHGALVNFSGKKYNFQHYSVDPKTHCIDYEGLLKQAREVKPKLIVAGATAYPRYIDFETFRKIADDVDAQLLVDMSHIAGLIIGGVHPDPVPVSDIVTSTTHKTLRGPRGAIILSKKEYAQNIDKAVFPVIQAGPHQNTIAAKAVAFHEANTSAFRKYARQVVSNAQVLAEELLRLGYDLVSGGTDNHLMVINLTEKGVTGDMIAKTLDKAGITTNKNLIPYDTKKPSVASGIRIGTPAMTTRGLKEKDMIQIAQWIDRGIRNMNNESALFMLKSEIKEYIMQFPLYTFLDS